MPHPAFKWRSETCPVLLPVVSWQPVHVLGCLPACGQHGRACGSPSVQLCRATFGHPGRLCTYRGGTSHTQKLQESKPTLS